MYLIYILPLVARNSNLWRKRKKEGFTFDMGPSWYMMPEVFERFFNHFGKKSSDFYTLIRLKPSYTVFFEKAAKVRVPTSIQAAAKLFEKIEAGAGSKFIQYLERARLQYELATTELIYQDLTHYSAWFKVRLIPQYFKLLSSTKLWQSWADYTKKFFNDDRLRKIITFPAVFLGGSPYMTPAVFSLLSWADFGKGIWYPKGGMSKVVEALRTLCIENGVKIILNSDVDHVSIKGNQITSVSANNKQYPVDQVVVTGDLAHFELNVLPEKYQTYPASYWKKKTMGISAVLLYIGLTKKLTDVTHHNLYFSDDWEDNFESIFKHKKLPIDPSFYVSIRSVSDQSIVPAGGEELFVLIPVASKLDGKRNEYQEMGERAIAKIEQLLEQKITDSIVVKEIFTPNDFAHSYHAHHGTALGIAHTLFQSFIFRPGNRSTKLSNLLYAGQYTNPGIGVPMTLISAEVVSDLIGGP